MEQWITQFMEQFGYFGIALLIFLENIFPPIPSEIILTFGGFMTTKSSLGFIGVTVASTLGSIIGAIVLYGIGLWIGEDKLYRLVNRYGKILRVKSTDLTKTFDWFEKYGYWTIFFCRFVPLIRSLISIPAGITKMNFSVFVIFSTLGTIIWNMVLIYLGLKVGGNRHQIVYHMDIYSKVTYVILLLIVIYFIWKWLKRVRKNKQK